MANQENKQWTRRERVRRLGNQAMSAVMQALARESVGHLFELTTWWQ